MSERDDPLLTVDEREAKLPRWAQAKLANLRSDLEGERARHQQALLLTKPDESLGVLGRFGAKPIGLGERPEVTFLPKPNAWLDSIDARLWFPGDSERPLLELMSSGTPIRIIAAASNHIYVDWGYHVSRFGT